MMCGGTTLWLLSFLTAKAVTVPATVANRAAWPELGAAFAALLLFVAHGELRPVLAVFLLALALVVLVVLHQRRRTAA